MVKIPVYFMPGLAAGPAIFENITLPSDTFEMHFLEWEIPFDSESLADYAKRICNKIKHKNPVLIGVSFGGILVQEMSKFVMAQKVIIISSVRSNTEFPRRMKITRALKAYKLVPTDVAGKIEKLARFSFGEKINGRLKLYEKYLSVRDDRYLSWAIRNVILWDRMAIDGNVIHIHGDSDEVFPFKNISSCIKVEGGTHVMILSKSRWLNENLPKIILGNGK